MKLAKGQYVYQVYLNNVVPEEAELIKWLEPLAKRRKASEQITRILIQFHCGGNIMVLPPKREMPPEPVEDEELPPMRQLPLEDMPPMNEQDMLDNWTQSFKFGN